MGAFRVVVMLLAVGCVFPVGGDRETLRARASFDMQCPAADLRVTELDAAVAGVDGCGRRETYVFSASAGTWVLNSPGSAQSQLLLDRPPAPPNTTSTPAGVPPGSPPGTLPGALPGTPPGTPPGVLPGAPPGSPPGTPPGPRFR